MLGDDVSQHFRGTGFDRVGAGAQERVPPSIPGLEQKIAAMLPTADEDAFLQIPWRLNIMQARAESLRTGKPMFVWEMNGHPLCHT